MSIAPKLALLIHVLILQDVPKETENGESYEKHNRKITEENSDVFGSNNKDNFEIVSSHDEHGNVRWWT